MRILFLALLLFGLVGSGTGFACRCEQRPLAEYSTAADHVLMARLVASRELPDRRTLRFELVAAPYRGADHVCRFVDS